MLEIFSVFWPKLWAVDDKNTWTLCSDTLKNKTKAFQSQGLDLKWCYLRIPRVSPLFSVPTPENECFHLLIYCKAEKVISSSQTLSGSFNVVNCMFFTRLVYLSHAWISQHYTTHCLGLAWQKSQFIWACGCVVHTGRLLIEGIILSDVCYDLQKLSSTGAQKSFDSTDGFN